MNLNEKTPNVKTQSNQPRKKLTTPQKRKTIRKKPHTTTNTPTQQEKQTPKSPKYTVPHQNKPDNSHKQNNPIFALTYLQKNAK